MQFLEHNKCTLSLTEKAACGYPMLGIFAVCIVSVMKQEYSTLEFCVDYQFKADRDKKYAADSCMILVSDDGTQYPLIVFEYKPKVSAELCDQPSSHLSELIMKFSVSPPWLDWQNTPFLYVRQAYKDLSKLIMKTTENNYYKGQPWHWKILFFNLLFVPLSQGW